MSAPHPHPSTTAEESHIGDFVLFEEYRYPQQNNYSQAGPTLIQPSIASAMGSFDPLSSNFADELQHQQQQQINKQFFTTAAQEYNSLSMASSAPPYDHHSAYSSFSDDVPRSMGSSFSDDHTSAAPNVLIHPPTLPYLPSHRLPHEYTSTPSASPSTSNTEYNGSGSGTDGGSTRGSPFQSVSDTFGKLAFQTSFVDPNLITSSAEQPPRQEHNSGSPYPSPNWGHIQSPGTSPKLLRNHSGGRSPSNRPVHHPYARRSSTSSARSSWTSPHGSPTAGTIEADPVYEYHTGGRMIPALPGRSPSQLSTTSGKGDGPAISGKDGKETLCLECNKCFRDLRAHQLTHLHERPEKCPIATCEYSRKGFARKYDCQRHTLTHYKGTMVCGFCPGSGSAMEKSFNRADVFKRHLMAVHNVEQTAPNGRQKKPTNTSASSSSSNKGKSTTSPTPPPGDFSSGKCSTCAVTFATAQQFYEHLDECVLSKVCEEEPAAAANEANLSQVKLEEVEAVLSPSLRRDDTSEEDDEMDIDPDDPKDESYGTSGKRKRAAGKKGRGQSESISTVKPPMRRRKKRKNFPAAWGAKPEQMVTKRRCLSVYDGPRIICKDEMMMSTEYEVKTSIGKDGGVQVSDLDFWTLRRAEAFLNAAPSRGGEAMPLGVVH